MNRSFRSFPVSFSVFISGVGLPKGTVLTLGYMVHPFFFPLISLQSDWWLVVFIPQNQINTIKRVLKVAVPKYGGCGRYSQFTMVCPYHA